MSLKKYLERIKRIDKLIRLRATGSPKEFAQKLNISESLLYATLSEMKDFGAKICYDKVYNTYYYKNEQIEIDFSFKPLEKSEQQKIIWQKVPLQKYSSGENYF